MEQATHTEHSTAGSQSTDKLFMENTLLRVAGALFCHDAKRAPQRTGQIVVNQGATDKQIAIRPDPQLGQPGPLAHRIFVALIKKHSDYGRPIQTEVSFTKRELMRLAGRKQWGGADSDQLLRAITQIQTTLVSANFRNREGRYIEERFNIFSKTRIERREFASDPIETCTITLAEPIVHSLQDEHFTCLNHALMISLGTIGQALYIRFFFHFANRFDGRNNDQLEFTKRYDDICTEWLGGLTIVKHRSKILDRLGSHLDQLVAHGFLASYRITKAKSRPGFILVFRPGPLFFQDYDRFYRRSSRRQPSLDFRADRRETAEPLKLAYLFVEKRTGRPAASDAFISTKDKETAKQLLAQLSFDQVAPFIDYALAEARRTNFDVQTLGGIKQYLAGYMAFQTRQKSAKAAQAVWKAKEKAEAERMAYESYRRAQAIKLFEALPADQRSEIEQQANVYASGFHGSLRDRMFASRRYHLMLTQHGDRLPTFDQWKENRASA
jgi:hypothetical protein